MNYGDARERVYDAFMKAVNDEPQLGDELAALAAQDALAEAYGLDEYPMPPQRKSRAKAAATAGRKRGSKGKPPCRA